MVIEKCPGFLILLSIQHGDIGFQFAQRVVPRERRPAQRTYINNTARIRHECCAPRLFCEHTPLSMESFSPRIDVTKMLSAKFFISGIFKRSRFSASKNRTIIRCFGDRMGASLL